MADYRRTMSVGGERMGAHSMEWLAVAKETTCTLSTGPIVKCLCSKCENRKYYKKETIKRHLCYHGIIPNYIVWHAHGESAQRDLEMDEHNDNDMRC